MRACYLISLFVILFLTGCNSGVEKPLTDEQKMNTDSLSKAGQKLKADSLKRTNPLLIIPPDSIYTGSYVDKYPNGITKFTGFFRFGKRHGQWMSFYQNGLAWSEMHYDKGLREGPNMTYYENGKMRYAGFYKADKKDSIWCYYDSLGKVQERLLFKGDRLIKKLSLQ